MTPNPQTAEACCEFHYWEHVHTVPEGQVWVDVCPEHGQRVGSEVVLSYPLADASPPKATAAPGPTESP